MFERFRRCYPVLYFNEVQVTVKTAIFFVILLTRCGELLPFLKTKISFFSGAHSFSAIIYAPIKKKSISPLILGV